MKIEMRLVSRHGEPRRRVLAARTLRKENLSNTMARVLAPADVAGMAFLFRQKKGGSDDQFMYMPALRIVKRIAGSQKSSRFLTLGSFNPNVHFGLISAVIIVLALTADLVMLPAALRILGPKV